MSPGCLGREAVKACDDMHMIDLEWQKDDETNRRMLVATNNTGGEIHGFALQVVGRLFFYPPPWPDGVSHVLWTRVPGQGPANIAVSYCVWYADGDVDNLVPIEQITPSGGGGQGNSAHAKP